MSLTHVPVNHHHHMVGHIHGPVAHHVSARAAMPSASGNVCVSTTHEVTLGPYHYNTTTTDCHPRAMTIPHAHPVGAPLIHNPHGPSASGFHLPRSAGMPQITGGGGSGGFSGSIGVPIHAGPVTITPSVNVGGMPVGVHGGGVSIGIGFGL